MTRRQTSEHLFTPEQTRSSLGRRDQGFVFCCWCGAERRVQWISAVPEETQLGKAGNVRRTKGFPQTPRPAAGCGVLAVLHGDPGLELLHCSVSFDLDKVMCQQGLFKRVLGAAESAFSVPPAHVPGSVCPVGGPSSAGPAWRHHCPGKGWAVTPQLSHSPGVGSWAGLG